MPTYDNLPLTSVMPGRKTHCRILKHFHMLRTTALWPVASKFSRMHRSGGWVDTMTPKKQANDDAGEVHILKAKANPDPTVAFSTPPPLPPVLGPLFALSLLDSWLKRDSNDD